MSSGTVRAVCVLKGDQVNGVVTFEQSVSGVSLIIHYFYYYHHQQI